jgi:hypothetical protein
MKKIYISGKITGIEDQAPELFKKTAHELLKQEFHPINPMTLNHNHDKSWHSYMREDIKALCDCDLIYMLSNWKDSKGAIIENQIANFLGLEVIFQQKEIISQAPDRNTFAINPLNHEQAK